jgi:uncharacterized PurR-regulated membrane protein YhhQ (DUF165 family)
MAGRMFCVSYAAPQDLATCLRIGQSVMLDNGAFSVKTRGIAFDMPGFYGWIEPHLGHPHWAVVPDEIGGTVEQQRAMVATWPHRKEYGAPVWHLGLPLEYLFDLCNDWPRVSNSRGSMLTIAILIYAAAMTVANLTIAHFGPWVSPINAFVLIGLDLALRDWLHVRLRAWQMLALIGASGVLTYALNPSAQHIVIASAAAFTLAALVDWQAFSRLSGSWLRRSLGSNVVGAVVDTAVFSALAFVLLAPNPKPLEVVAQIAGLQLLAKVAGGSLWAWALARTVQRVAA